MKAIVTLEDDSGNIIEENKAVFPARTEELYGVCGGIVVEYIFSFAIRRIEKRVAKNEDRD